MKIDILTLFPEFFSLLHSWSIVGRAVEQGVLNLNCINIRDFSLNKHKKVDDYPFGGGHGMVMTPQPIFDSIESVKGNDSKVIYLSPQGKKLNQTILKDLSREKHLIFLCGHYEGIDNRIIDNYVHEEISIGDYVLTGGEIPAMVLIDGIIRLLPGVLNNEESYRDESHFNGLLEYPHYTRPRVFRGLEVPKVLLSGNHELINKWKKIESLKSTIIKRPDLLANQDLSPELEEFITLIKSDFSS